MNSVQAFIKKFNLVIDKSKSSDQIVHIRSSISNEEEALVFVKKFSQKTGTTWCSRYRNFKIQKCIYRKGFICYWGDRKLKNVAKNGTCEAKLDIKIKKINRHTCKNDPFLSRIPPLPGLIRISNKHNHDDQQNHEDTNYIRVPDEVKELFYGYFDNGFGVAKAIKLYKENLLQNGVYRRSPRLTPTSRQIYHIYKLWMNKKRVSGVVCENIEDYLETVNVDEFIKVIPHEDPASQERLKCLPISTEYKNKIVISGIKTPASSTSFVPIRPKLKKSIPSAVGNSNSSIKKIYLVRRPISTQHISVNSASHLNGSILTVVNSGSVIPFIPTFSSNQTSVAMTPKITSVMSLEKNESNTTKLQLNAEINSESVSNHLYSHSTLPFATSANSAESILPDDSKSHITDGYKLSENCEIKVESSSEDSQLNMLESSKSCFSSSYENLTTPFNNFYGNSKQLPKTNKIISSSEMCLPMLTSPKSVISNISSSTTSSHDIKYSCVSSTGYSSTSSLINESGSICFNQTTTASDAFQEHRFNSKSDMNTQIVTNTVHQSGAQVSVNSPSRCSEMPILSAVHISESSSPQLLVKDSVKVKVEPPDEYEENTVMDIENSNTLPTIASVNSLNVVTNLTYNEPLTLSQVKVESINDVSRETDVLMLSEDISSGNQAASSILDDEDHQFLMSLLPELKRIPKDVKTKLKSQVQNLFLTARLNTCKKSSDETNKIYHNSMDINKILHNPRDVNKIYHNSRDMNKIYHDCRILPSFPAFK